MMAMESTKGIRLYASTMTVNISIDRYRISIHGLCMGILILGPVNSCQVIAK